MKLQEDKAKELGKEEVYLHGGFPATRTVCQSICFNNC